jgi:hypothetical protein
MIEQILVLTVNVPVISEINGSAETSTIDNKTIEILRGLKFLKASSSTGLKVGKRSFTSFLFVLRQKLSEVMESCGGF